MLYHDNIIQQIHASIDWLGTHSNPFESGIEPQKLPEKFKLCLLHVAYNIPAKICKIINGTQAFRIS